ncbi:MAG: histidine phosphatase family protein [Clostridia bacterium]|nr:histidine phosphatase family protein [Clostridia bacterium]
MKIYLIRHSESQDDLINCIGGAADWDITENGIKKVEKFEPKFKKFEVEKIYTSPLKRAYKTAEILNKHTKLEIVKLFDLRETNHYGFLTGLEINLAKQLFGYMIDEQEYSKISYYNKKCMPGGETSKELDKRIKKTMKQILKESSKLNAIAIVTHGGVLRSIFYSFLKIKKKILKIEDVACAEIELKNGKFKVIETSGFVFEK